MSKRPTLHVRIVAPTNLVYEGDVHSVSAANHVGPFDVLPGHVNFFTLLSSGEVVVNQAGTNQSFKVQKGILKVQDDTVTVYANAGASQ